MHPDPADPNLEVVCSAKVIDRRSVVSSNGVSESRYVISSPVTVGDRTWNIEITLTNRETMGYRMLLGRGALSEDISIVPSASFQQAELDYSAYKKLKRRKSATKRPLRIAILTQEPNNYSNRSMIKAAEALKCIMTGRPYRAMMRLFRVLARV